jgi:DNA ligase-1
MMAKILYGLDKGGSYKVWKIWTVGEELFIEHGKEGGKQQLKRELVKGKNIGRANETSPTEQAVLEAESRYKKQIDKGYRETKEELTELPLLPMLAHDYLKQGHRIKYPCYGSKKLDGVRCLAIRHPDRVQLKSRGGKDYAVAHVQQELMHLMGEGEIWDGELYIHGKYLEEIVSAVKKPNENTPDLMFVAFDIVNDKPFEERLRELNVLKNRLLCHAEHAVTLGYHEVMDEAHMKQLHKEFVAEGYEGIMLRNLDGLYESGKRSADLQKYKEFFDEEFQIVDVAEDRNENGVLVVWDALAGTHFDVCFGDFDERKRQLANPENYKGKLLTVKYQTRYKDSKLPQFPTGVAIRDYE